MATLRAHGTEVGRYVRGPAAYSFRSDGTLLAKILGRWKLIRRKCDESYFSAFAMKLEREGFTKETA